MMYYRQKPVSVEAYQLSRESYKFIMDWLRVHEIDFDDHGWEGSRRFIVFYQHEGRMKVCESDWIVREVTGEFTVYQNETFCRSYESSDYMNSTAKHCAELIDTLYIKGDLSERAAGMRAARDAILKKYGE